MKKLLISILLLTSLLSYADGVKSPFIGQWEGALNIQPKNLRLVVDIAEMEGKTVGILYSIDQSSQGMAMSKVSIKGRKLEFNVDSINASFVGNLNGKNIKGTFAQNGMKFPLEFMKKDTPSDVGPSKPTEFEMPKDLEKTLGGNWKGVTNINGAVLPLNLIFKKLKNNKYNVFLVSPKQSSAEISVTKISFDKNKFFIDIEQIAMKMSCTVDKDKIDADIKQSGIDMKAVFKK